jgi:type I site-specific restriction endonuclease
MTNINKKSRTELDICTKFINPALKAAGWDLMPLPVV